ncbi:MAG: exopolysaccharide biosynthesis polyprenyl glycosylphosphotransferase [Bryobacterales bacterium]|jgi:exopolysaccharide biosynthesis polyprenyl glycosylphosphotransferase|nr:exopolysaccharide biosynthesis polyprenyl glycosylphosphotransferase [Bryobacterales bacterium]
MTIHSRNCIPPAPSGPVFQITRILFDLAALIIAWKVTLEIRVALNEFMPRFISRSSMHIAAPSPLGLLVLWILAALWLKIYREDPDTSLGSALLRTTKSAILVSTLVIVLTFFSRQLGAERSRSFVLLFAPISFVLLVASLYLSLFIAARVERRWRTPKRLAVLGAGAAVHDLADAIRRAGGESVSVLGLILPESAVAAATAGPSGSSGSATALETLRVLGTTRDLAELINRESLDRIIIASGLTQPEVEDCDRVTHRMGITVSRPIQPARTDVLVKHQREFGLDFIDLRAAPFSHRQEIIKRAVDLAGSLMLTTVLLPLFALIAFAIRVTSAGPIFYKARRVGKGGRYFTFWKFRSMYVNGPSRDELRKRNETSGHLFKIRTDPRITPVGRVLRRLSLDELPQLLNVLAGDMSLVGPRPLPVEDLDPDGMSSAFAHWAEQRAHVRPGITGLWQVSGRSELPFSKMMELDVEYILNWSLSLDLKLLFFETPRAVLSGRGAY